MWDPIVIPGLFQIAEYTAALTQSGAPGCSDSEVRRIVELRLARQREVFKDQGGPFVHSVISEASLRLLVGGKTSMRAQLQHLLTIAEHPNVNLQILLFSAGANPGVNGAFTIFSPPPELARDHGLVYIDNRLQSYYYQKEDQVKKYSTAISQLHKQALTPDRSPVFINNLVKELE